MHGRKREHTQESLLYKGISRSRVRLGNCYYEPCLARR